MRTIVKGVVVGTVGLAVLLGSPALSLAAAPKSPIFDPSTCTQTSPDRWTCRGKDGKDCICPFPDPKYCSCLPPRGPGIPLRQQAPVVKPKTPGGDMLMK